MKSFRSVSIFMYIVSLFIPIFSASEYTGLSALISGLIYLDVWEASFALPWLANILYFFNLITYKRWPIPGIYISILSISMALFALGIKEVLINEGGSTECVSVGVGFVFWLGSFMMLLAGQIRRNKI